MSQQQRRKTNVRRPVAPKAFDLWKPVPQPPEVVKIRNVQHPDSLLGSIGDPPLGMKSVVAGHYLATVIERSAGVARALALSANLLETSEAD